MEITRFSFGLYQMRGTIDMSKNATKKKTGFGVSMEMPTMKRNPTLRVNSRKFPQLLKAGMNKTVKMNVSGKVKSINPSYESPGTHDIELDITHAKHVKKSGWNKHIGV